MGTVPRNNGLLVLSTGSSLAIIMFQQRFHSSGPSLCWCSIYNTLFTVLTLQPFSTPASPWSFLFRAQFASKRFQLWSRIVPSSQSIETIVQDQFKRARETLNQGSVAKPADHAHACQLVRSSSQDTVAIEHLWFHPPSRDSKIIKMILIKMSG